MNPGEFILLIILVPFVVSILANELTGWFPWLAEKMLEYWAQKLPKQARQRWLDEWLGELDTIPGGIFKLWFACCHGIGIKALKREELRKAIQVLNDNDEEELNNQKSLNALLRRCETVLTVTVSAISLKSLGVSNQILHSLKEGGVASLVALLALSERDLENISGLDVRSIDEIKKQLATQTMKLKD
jgi:Bacterial RNA polymerase, alpha chain C terminal domain